MLIENFTNGSQINRPLPLRGIKISQNEKFYFNISVNINLNMIKLEIIYPEVQTGEGKIF